MKIVTGCFFSILIFVLSLAPQNTQAAQGFAFFNWKDHAQPFTFLFGNHIDTHQQTQLRRNGDLWGFFYIVYLDMDGDGAIDTTDDGLPIAGHCTKAEHYPNCQVGWIIKAKPCIKEINGCTAMFLYHKHDHPVWLIGPRLRTVKKDTPDEETFLDGSRPMIPQPGSPTHYHWLTEGSTHTDMETGDSHLFPSSLTDIEARFGVDINVPAECNVAMASKLTTGVICPGYFLEITVVQPKPFAFKHGGEAIPVSKGTDLRTHINYVTSYVAVDVPTDGLPTVDDGGMDMSGGTGESSGSVDGSDSGGTTAP